MTQLWIYRQKNTAYPLSPHNMETVQGIIQFLKVMYLVLTVQVPLTLPVVFCETDSVFLGADTHE